MRTPAKLVLLVVLALSLSWAATGEAAWPYGWGPCGDFYGGLYPGYVLRPDQLDRLPHFALFPPVYYSCRVPRAYGYSPFASPPDIISISHQAWQIEARAAPASVPEPKIIRNPFVKAAEGPARASKAAAAPMVVRNHFCAEIREIR